MYTSQCPRCGSICFEHLSTHSHCYGCNYSPEDDYKLARWRDLEFKDRAKAKLNYLRDPLNTSVNSAFIGVGGVL